MAVEEQLNLQGRFDLGNIPSNAQAAQSAISGIGGATDKAAALTSGLGNTFTASTTKMAEGAKGAAGASDLLGGALGKVGAAAFGMVEAFKKGLKIGTEMKTLLTDLGVVSEQTWKKFDLSDRFADAMVNGGGLFDVLSKLAGVTDTLTEAQARQAVVGKSQIAIENDRKNALMNAAQALRESIPAFKEHAEGSQEVAKGVDAMNGAIGNLLAQHGNLAQFALDNRAALMEWAEQLSKHPDLIGKLSTAARSLYEEMNKQREALEGVSEALKKSEGSLDKWADKFKSFGEGLDFGTKLQESLGRTDDAFEASFKEWGASADEAKAKTEEYRKKIDELKEAAEKLREEIAQGDMGAEEAQAAQKAIEAQTTALEVEIETYRRLRAETEAALNAASAAYRKLEADTTKQRHAELDAANAARQHGGSIEGMREQFSELDVELGQVAGAFQKFAAVVEPATESVFDFDDSLRLLSDQMSADADAAGMAAGYLNGLTNQFRSGKIDVAEFTRKLDDMKGIMGFFAKETLFPNIEADSRKLKKAAADISAAMKGLPGVFDPFVEASAGAVKTVEENLYGLVTVADEVMGAIEQRAVTMGDNVGKTLGKAGDGLRAFGAEVSVTASVTAMGTGTSAMSRFASEMSQNRR